jgi:hypothetical protein
MIDSYDRLIRVKSLFILSAVFLASALLFTTPAAADTQISFGQMISESINSPQSKPCGFPNSIICAGWITAEQ